MVNLTEYINKSMERLHVLNDPMSKSSGVIRQIELTNYNYGAIILVRNIAIILLSLSEVIYNTNEVELSLIFLNTLVHKTDYIKLLKSSFELVELESQETLCKAAGNLLAIGRVVVTS